MSQGYARIADSRRRDDAVQWWYWHDEDGWGFARGGRVRTIRDARHAIERAKHEQTAERRAYLNRVQYELQHDGSLAPVPRGPYGV